jgi:hypothetical protein
MNNKNHFIDRQLPAESPMPHSRLDIKSSQRIMTPDEVAQFFKKSTSWVYKNWKKLGGAKLGGSLFFPSKEDLYEQLFQERKGVEIRLHLPGNQVHGDLVQNQKRGSTSRSKQKGGIKEASTDSDDQNRHGLLGAS